MTDPGDDAWYLAHSFAERIAAGPSSGLADDELGRIRLKMWRQEPVHARRPERLAQHLERHGLDEARFVGVLGENPAAVRARFDGPPAFARRIADAWRRHGETPVENDEALGFAVIAAPLLRDAVERVRAEAATLVEGHAHLTAGVLADRLGAGPVDTVNMLVARTLVLELNVLRLRGELAGSDSHARYHHFLHLLRRPERALAVLREYPVLARDVVRAIDDWTASRIEFARHLVADYAELSAHGELGDLAELSFGAGDSHRGGRSVAAVRFATGARVMYKPRRLSVDRHFQELLVWLNERGDHPPLRTFWVLDRREYGWTEFVESAPCPDRAALERFHRRQGALLAVLQVLGGTDFHLENIIASGEDPMLIDLEAMLHNWQRQLPPDADTGHLPRAAVELMRSSVTAVGLLPVPVVWTEDDRVNRFDLSGMSGAGGQLTARPVAVWDGMGTDEMRLTRRRLNLPGSANLPTIAASEADATPPDTPDVTEFAAEIVGGYGDVYRTLLDHRAELLAAGGPIAAFADDEVRVVARATESYMRLLVEGQHPDLLRDALDRDRYLENLWAGHDGRDGRDALISAEIAQIRAGDVPIFVTTPSSTDLRGGDGSTVPGALHRTGLDVVGEQVAALSEAHLAQQSWFIEASLTALTMGTPSKWRPAPRPPRRERTVGEPRFVEAAHRVGDRLLATALGDDERISWLGLSLIADEVWSLSPTGLDLYNGISGIGLFLGYLARATGDAEHRRGAERAAAMMTREASTWLAAPDLPDAVDVGAFGALGGTVYTLSHLSTVLERPDLAVTASDLATLLVRQVPGSREHDVIAGSAGALLSLLSLHEVAPDPDLLAGMRAVAGHLVGNAEEHGGGLAWRGAFHPDRPLAGFSHGASGVATALARLDVRAGTREYRDVVGGALRFERTLYDEELRNWRDMRVDTPDDNNMVAWCHGASGVALARAELLAYAEDADGVRGDLGRALAAVADPATGLHNHSVCHGDLGNAEILLRAAPPGGDEFADRAARITADVARDVGEGAWRCGVPRGVETPGLMSGLAGIGLALLRCADPLVPSVLALDPPAYHRGAIGLP